MTQDRPWVVVLAGGDARRMGGDKALRPWGGTTLIEATLARVIPQAPGVAINARPGELGDLGLTVVTDETDLAGLGPLSGVRSALAFARDRGLDRIVTVPCDMPRLPDDMVARLMATDAEVVAFEDAQLCALWRLSLLQPLEEALRGCGGGLSVRRFLDRRDVAWLPCGDGFDNINTLDDLGLIGAVT